MWEAWVGKDREVLRRDEDEEDEEEREGGGEKWGGILVGLISTSSCSYHLVPRIIY